MRINNMVLLLCITIQEKPILPVVQYLNLSIIPITTLLNVVVVCNDRKSYIIVFYYVLRLSLFG